MYARKCGINGGADRQTALRLGSLIAALASRDPTTRQHARHTLVRCGEKAVNSLIKALRAPEKQVRWEAAKALVDIASPKAAPVLVATLRDEEGGIRWLAAEALIALGPYGLEPLLQGLVDHPGSPFMRAGAHHILHELVPGPLSELVLPVLAALEGPAPECRAPVAAHAALETLREYRQTMSVGPSSRETRGDQNPRRRVS
jgi:HEAT repeat protein